MRCAGVFVDTAGACELYAVLQEVPLASVPLSWDGHASVDDENDEDDEDDDDDVDDVAADDDDAGARGTAGMVLSDGRHGLVPSHLGAVYEFPGEQLLLSLLLRGALFSAPLLAPTVPSAATVLLNPTAPTRNTSSASMTNNLAMFLAQVCVSEWLSEWLSE